MCYIGLRHRALLVYSQLALLSNPLLFIGTRRSALECARSGGRSGCLSLVGACGREAVIGYSFGGSAAGFGGSASGARLVVCGRALKSLALSSDPVFET